MLLFIFGSSFHVKGIQKESKYDSRDQTYMYTIVLERKHCRTFLKLKCIYCELQYTLYNKIYLTFPMFYQLPKVKLLLKNWIQFIVYLQALFIVQLFAGTVEHAWGSKF